MLFDPKWFCFFPFLGGYGKSPDSESLKTDQSRVELLSRFMESLGVRTAVLVSPSMSGHYSIPFLVKSNAQLRGFVPIAPVGTRNYTPQQYQNIQVRILRLWPRTREQEELIALKYHRGALGGATAPGDSKTFLSFRLCARLSLKILHDIFNIQSSSCF